MKRAPKKESTNWRREFADIFRESLSYVKAQRKLIYLVCVVFFLGSFGGFIFSDSLTFFDEILLEISENTKNLDYLEMIWFIFSNNLTSSLFALLFGIFFGVFPFFNALFNGALLGYVYSLAAPVAGYGIIWRLVPHGIFELPAVFISLGLGVHFGMALFGPNKRDEIIYRLKKSFQVFITLTFVLLAIAAIVESTLIYFSL